MRERTRDIIIIHACDTLGVHIVKGVLARDHIHLFLLIPPKLSVSDVMQRIMGRSSRRIQLESPTCASSIGEGAFGRVVFLYNLWQRDGQCHQAVLGNTFFQVMPRASAGGHSLVSSMFYH